MYKDDVTYSVFLRRNCLVGGLCYDILGLLDLWLPTDGELVYKLFFFRQGDTHVLNGVLSNFR